MLLHPSHWNYLAEGNQHLLLTHHSSIPSFQGKVLRLSKESPPLLTQHQHHMHNLDLQLQKCFSNYLKKKSDRFIIGESLQVDKQISTQFVAQLAQQVEPFRPQNRKCKKIDINTDLILEQNMSHSTTSLFSIEIKPKSCLYDKYDVHQQTRLIEQGVLDKHHQIENTIQNTKYYKGKLGNTPTNYHSVLFFKEQTRLQVMQQQIGSNNLFQANGPVDLIQINQILIQEQSVLDIITRLQAIYDAPIQNIKVHFDSLVTCLPSLPLSYEQLCSLESILDGAPPNNPLEWVFSLLVSHTMRDLSLLVDVSTHSHRLGIIDVELKPLSKVPSYLSQDALYFEKYLHHLTS